MIGSMANQVSARDQIAKFCNTHLAPPPFDPFPSQYACPFPSITAPDAPVIRIFVPEMTMGLKSLFEVLPKVVLPAKVTAAPVLSLDRSIELEAGAEMPDRMIFEQDATAAEIEAYAVTVQAVPVPPLPTPDVVVVAFVAVVVDLAVVVVFNVVAAVVAAVAVAKQLHSLEILLGLLEQADAHAGRDVVAVLVVLV
jgi:hypothetical protein